LARNSLIVLAADEPQYRFFEQGHLATIRTLMRTLANKRMKANGLAPAAYRQVR